MDGLEKRRSGLEHDIDDQPQHDDAEYLYKQVHRTAGVLQEKYTDRDAGADDRTDLDRKIEQDIKSEPGSGDVSNVKGETAEGDERGQNITASGDRLICDVLGPLAADSKNPLDIELSKYIEDDRDQDDETETREKLICKNRRLRQKSRADGRCRHQECRTENDRSDRALFH